MTDIAKSVILTPSDAKAILDRVDHPLQKQLQRKIRPTHVENLASEMRLGFFVGNTVYLVKCLEKNLEFLLNGHHTLRACVKSGCNVPVILVEKTVNTLEEAAKFFTKLDRPLIRTIADSFRGYRMSTDRINSEITDAFYGRLVAAIRVIASNFSIDKSSKQKFNDERLIEAANLYTEQFVLLRQLSKGTDVSDKLLSRAYLPIILISLRFLPNKAIKFWSDVASAEGLSRHDPAFRLREYLKFYTVGRSPHAKSYRIEAADLLKVISICWNAYMDNRQLHQIRYYNSSLNFKGLPVPTAVKEVLEVLSKTDEEFKITSTDFSKIQFNERFHSYQYDGVTLAPVTRFVKSLHPDFDKVGHASGIAARDGRRVDDVISEWEAKGKQSRKLGTITHDYIERVLNGEVVDELKYRLNGSAPKEMASFDKFWENASSELVLVKSEWVIGDVDYKLGGKVDAVFSSSDGYVLIDWKTGKIDEWKSEFFYAPFDTIPNDKLYHYSFQLSAYKIIIERNTNLKISKMYIVHLKPDGEKAEVIEAIDYSYDLKRHLDERCQDSHS